jgi:putative hemolysin
MLQGNLGAKMASAKVRVMTVPFRKGRYVVRWAQAGYEVAACQALRHRCFFGVAGLDRDSFDPVCRHLMIVCDAGLAATCRVRVFDRPAEISLSYASQSYDLAKLSAFPLPVMEVGRFCVDPGLGDADVLRLAWGALAQMVDAHGVGLLFGCSSFAGIDPARYAAAFGYLASRHLAPVGWSPAPFAAEIVKLLPGADARGAVAQLPPLLRSYLAMGGWVSDHAVVDRQLQTLHVFTAVEIATIPASRAQVLRAAAF